LVTHLSLGFDTLPATPNRNQKRGARRVRQNKSPALRLMEKDAQANHMPQFQSTVHVKHHFRYQVATNGFSGNITRANLLNLMAVGSTTGGTTQAARIFSGVKLNRVELRSIGTNPGTGNDTLIQTSTIEWTSTYGPSSEISDSGTALHPPFIQTSPPSQSLASFWSLTGSNETDVLMVLNLPASSSVDIWIEAIMQDGQSVVEVALSSATLGVVYALALDGPSSNRIVPVSYTTTS
jgi:hypothetical protein